MTAADHDGKKISWRVMNTAHAGNQSRARLITTCRVGDIMNFILWVILATNGAQPAPAIDHAEYTNLEACQHAADQIRESLAGVQFQVHTICTTSEKTK
jgi:hypothetical protein